MIREATADDLEFCVDLWREWWDEAPMPRWTWESLLAVQQATFEGVTRGLCPGVALVELDGGVLLWADLQRSNVLHGFGVYVRPELRGRNIGTRLALEGIRLGRQRGFERILVSPYAGNVVSRKWLASLGFLELQVVLGKEL